MEKESKFDPTDEKYKQVKDLPYGVQHKYEDINEEDGGGFAIKESVENYESEKQAAAIIKNITGEDLKAEDVLLDQFIKGEEKITKEKKEALKTLQEGGSVRLDFDTIGLTENREIMMQAVKNNGANLQYASFELLGDKELVLEAVRRYKNDNPKKYYTTPFKYAVPLQGDREFVMEIMDIDASGFYYAADHLKSDESIALKAISLGIGLEYIGYSLRSNKEFVRKAVYANVDCIESSVSFRDENNDIAIDKELAIDIVNRKGESLYFLPWNLKNDTEVIVVAIKNNPESIKYVPESIKKKIISILKNN